MLFVLVVIAVLLAVIAWLLYKLVTNHVKQVQRYEILFNEAIAIARDAQRDANLRDAYRRQ